jgi:hypothetical protein
MKEKKPAATVNEEPTSSATTNEQINQGSPEDTRNVGKRQDQAQQGEKQQGQGGCCSGG